MRILSVKYPWSQALVAGLKDVENRDWKTAYRGPVAIHQSKTSHWSDLNYFLDVARWAGVPETIRAGVTRTETAGFWPGCIVGVVDLVDCVTESASPWFAGLYGFVVANPRPLPRPISYLGALGLRPLPGGVIAEIAAQLEEATA